MRDRRDSRTAEFLALLRKLDQLLSSVEPGPSFGALADAYDLSAARDEIARFIKSGIYEDFALGSKRLTALAARRGLRNQHEINGTLDSLSKLASDLSHEDLQAVGASRERESPGPALSAAKTERVDVLVLSAMYDPELLAILPRMVPFESLVGTISSGLPDITYFVGSIPTTKRPRNDRISIAALFLTRTGLTDCASIVASAMRLFRPRLIAMVGVCAGRRALKVRTNDIIVPSSSFTFDTGKYSETEFQKEPHWADASSRVIQRVQSVANIVIEDVCRQITPLVPSKVRRPNIHCDVMACGSSVIDRAGMIDQIADHYHRKVAALDMESYAFFRSATLTNPDVPRVVVKGVMDYSTGKSDRVKAQAAFWAAAFLDGLLRMDFEQLVQPSD